MSFWTDEDFRAGEDGGAGGGYVEASGAVAQQVTPVGEPADAAFDDPLCSRHTGLMATHGPGDAPGLLQHSSGA